MFDNSWINNSINYAAFAIPAFFIFLGLEYITAARQQKNTFKFDSTVANLSIGIAERLLSLFLTASFYELFKYVYEHYALLSIPSHWTVWVILLLATDLVWYWYHRLGHEVNVLWAAHIVHHQSEEFNYSVSARITSFQAIIRNVFWCVLPFVGFHPTMIITILIVHGTYSFFTHTELIHRLGWLEYILITPSHHRVHHSSNEKYINKNYGDLFVFWDKLFGTFEAENEKPVYGLTHPLKSNSFLWQHFHYFMELGLAVSSTKGLFNKIKILVGKPELLDQSLRTELEKTYLPEKTDTKPSLRYRGYLVIQLIIAILILFLTTLLYHQLTTITVTASALFILITLINCGALLEQRTWIYYLEYFRLLIVLNYIGYMLDSPAFLAVSLVFILVMLWPMQKWYLRLVYDIQ